MKYNLCILGGTCTDKYLYLVYTGSRILQVEKETGIAIDIIELKNAENRFWEYVNIFCQDKKIIMCPFNGDKIAIYENGETYYHNLGLGDNMQILAATFAQNELVMLSQKTEGFLSFNIETHKVNEIKTEHGFCGIPTVNETNEILWIIDRKGQVIENNQGKISILYQGNQKLKKYHRDNIGEYFIYLNGEVWKRSETEVCKLALLPDMSHADIGCYSMDGVLYIVYLDRNLIYIFSEKHVDTLTGDDCRYWTDEDGTVTILTVMPDQIHGGFYLYTNYKHKVIYLGLHGEIIEKPIYVRKQKPEMYMQEVRSDDLQSYFNASGYSKDVKIATLEDWITKI